jgi:hypothetical protein
MVIMASRESSQVASCDRLVQRLDELAVAVVAGVGVGGAVGTGVVLGRVVGVGVDEGAAVSVSDGAVNGAGDAIKVGMTVADGAAAFAADAHPEQVRTTSKRRGPLRPTSIINTTVEAGSSFIRRL